MKTISAATFRELVERDRPRVLEDEKMAQQDETEHNKASSSESGKMKKKPQGSPMQHPCTMILRGTVDPSVFPNVHIAISILIDLE